MRARALYDYAAERDDELSLYEGAVIEVLSQEGEWWLGCIGDAHGAFPSNYVELMGDLGRSFSGVL